MNYIMKLKHYQKSFINHLISNPNIKMIKKILIILILISIMCVNYTISYAEGLDNNKVLLDNGKVCAWKNIDNAQILLADGKNVANISTKRDFKMQEGEYKRIDNKEFDKNIVVFLMIDGSTKTQFEDRKTNTMKSIKKDCWDYLEKASRKTIHELWNQVEVSRKDFRSECDGSTIYARKIGRGDT